LGDAKPILIVVNCHVDADIAEVFRSSDVPSREFCVIWTMRYQLTELDRVTLNPEGTVISDTIWQEDFTYDPNG